MLTQKQLSERLNYLGASDAPAVLGLSRWKTPLSVWAEKTGVLVPEDISDKLHIKLGNKMETVLAELFEEETGKKLHRVNETKYHRQFPFLATNLDRRIVGENTIVELKTASAWKSAEWEGEEIPQEYMIQVYHQLAVTGYAKAYLCVLIGNSDLQIKEVVRDEKLIADLVRREVDFWENYVVAKVMPKLITKYDADTLDKLFPRAVPDREVPLPDEASQLVEFLDGYKKDLKNLEDTIEKTVNELKAMIKEGEVGITPLYKIGWFNSRWSGLDGAALKKDHPTIHAEYYKTKPIRKFTLKKLKENTNG